METNNMVMIRIMVKDTMTINNMTTNNSLILTEGTKIDQLSINFLINFIMNI